MQTAAEPCACDELPDGAPLCAECVAARERSIAELRRKFNESLFYALAPRREDFEMKVRP